MANDLTITMPASSDRVTVESLSAAIAQALTALHAIEAEGSWEVVRVTMHSPLKLTVRNRAADSRLRSHIKFVSAANGNRPLADSATTGNNATAVRAFGEILDDGFAGVRLAYGRLRPVTITPETAQKVTAAIRRTAARFTEWTTIRGMMDQITATGASRKFRLVESLTGRAIQCSFGGGIMGTVKAALPSRVEVYGRAEYDTARKLESMAAQSIRTLGSGVRISELPAIDITGDMDAADYVERVRGGD
jgi:hypothetical protein